ncbi:MAG: chloride channel protein [Actinomycetes bacterium]|jgi:H+/Cl- antiporter ClcA|nr:chloride channel protein [Actinomycetes bacterium]
MMQTIRKRQLTALWLRLRKNATMLVSVVVGGCAVGALLALFLWLLDRVTALREQHLWLIALLPVVAVATVWVYKRIGKAAERGVNLAIESVHGARYLPARMVVLAFLFSLLTHLTGGSAGREGVGVQIGAAFMHKVSRLLGLKHDMRRLFTLAGVSAGFAAIFGTPFAGAFFGLEMAYVGKLSYEAILPCFLASYSAAITTSLLGVSHHEPALSIPTHIDARLIAVVILAAIIVGIVARLFILCVHRLKDFMSDRVPNHLLRAALLGVVLAALILVFRWERYAGLSVWMAEAGFAGQTTIRDAAVKFLLTVLTLGVGLQGGEVTPMFGIGAALGGALGVLFGVDPALLAGLAMITVFGSAANTPLTTIALGIELFGTKGLPYYIAFALIAWLLVGNHSLYSSQIIVTSKYQSQRYLRHRSMTDAAGSGRLIGLWHRRRDD